MDHRSLARQAKSDHSSRIASRRGESPSDAAADKARIERAISQHDSQLHGGKKTRLHLKDGGCAEGSASASRLDRPGRARGGISPFGGGGKKKSKSGKGNTVNVIVASGGGEKERPVPIPVPAAGPPPRPPMPPPGPMGPGGPPGGPPMGGPPGAGGPPIPPRPIPGGVPMRADGGAAEAAKAHGKELAVHMKAGASSGMGRIAKSKLSCPDANAGTD